MWRRNSALDCCLSICRSFQLASWMACLSWQPGLWILDLPSQLPESHKPIPCNKHIFHPGGTVNDPMTSHCTSPASSKRNCREQLRCCFLWCTFLPSQDWDFWMWHEHIPWTYTMNIRVESFWKWVELELNFYTNIIHSCGIWWNEYVSAAYCWAFHSFDPRAFRQSKQLKIHGYMVDETFLAWLSDFCWQATFCFSIIYIYMFYLMTTFTRFLKMVYAY